MIPKSHGSFLALQLILSVTSWFLWLCFPSSACEAY